MINKVIKTDRRIDTLIDEIEGSVLIDVGCDHGYVTVGALLKGKVSRAIAVDISASSLSKTERLARECGVADKISTICADGLAPIDDAVDIAVIAGIGGYEIINILESAPRLPNRLVLCPHQNASELRKYISGKFCVYKDYIINAGDKFYPIIVLGYGNDEYREEELLFGCNYPPSDAYIKMIISRKEVLDGRFREHMVPEGKLKKEYEEVVRLCSKLKI